MKIIVVGLGNPILTDDGVGVKVAYAVEEALSPEAKENIFVTEASVGGLRLMELLEGYDHAIIVDAFKGHNGAKPGTIYRMTLDDLRDISPTQHSASPHDASLVTALALGIEMGMVLPGTISIIAVEVENILDFNVEPTPAVAAVIPEVTGMVLAELRDLTDKE